MLKIEEQIFAILEKSNNILITFTKEHNGDHISSALALYSFLQNMGKNTEIVCDNFYIKDRYKFLPKIEKINQNLGKNKNFIISLNTSKTEVDSLNYEKNRDSLKITIKPKNGYFTKEDLSVPQSTLNNDLIFIIGSPDLDSLGKIFEDNAGFFYHTPIINIDNSPENENFGQINLINLTAGSVSEIIFSLLSGKNFADKYNIDEKTAEIILTGIIDGTNSFKSPQVTPQTLNFVSRLISLGADREKIVKNLYQIYSVDNLKLWGRVLARLKESADCKLVWSLVTAEDFIKTNTNEFHIHGVIDELIINMPKIKIIALFYQDTKDNIKIILRNKSKIDLMPNLSKFNPKGNNKIIKISLPQKKLLEAEKEVIEKLKEVLIVS